MLKTPDCPEEGERRARAQRLPCFQSLFWVRLLHHGGAALTRFPGLAHVGSWLIRRSLVIRARNVRKKFPKEGDVANIRKIYIKSPDEVKKLNLTNQFLDAVLFSSNNERFLVQRNSIDYNISGYSYGTRDKLQNVVISLSNINVVKIRCYSERKSRITISNVVSSEFFGSSGEIVIDRSCVETLIIHEASDVFIKDSIIGSMEFVQPYGKRDASPTTFMRSMIRTKGRSGEPCASREQLQHLLNAFEAIGDGPAAHFIRGTLLRAEHERERGVMRLVSAIYRWTAGFGLRPGLAVFWFLLVHALSVCAIAQWGTVVETAHLAELGRDAAIARAFADPEWGCWIRAGYLSLQSVLNPLGIFGPRQLLVAGDWWVLILTACESIISLLLITVFGMSIRRRFRLSQ